MTFCIGMLHLMHCINHIWHDCIYMQICYIDSILTCVSDEGIVFVSSADRRFFKICF